MKQTVTYHKLENISYQEAWDLQEQLLKENVQVKLQAGKDAKPFKLPTQHYLLFCEHPHVYTIGKSGKINHLLINKDELAKKGISFFPINRGGDITYHGPGQITGYPIFDLEKFKTDLGWYLRSLEEVMIRVIGEYGLHGDRIPDATGVWLDTQSPTPRKICAFGVRCSRWVSMHGFALNVNTDLRYFDHIVPCGIQDKGVTSMEKELGGRIDMEIVRKQLREKFSEVFDIEIRQKESIPLIK